MAPEAPDTARAADIRWLKVKADTFYVRHQDGVWLRNNVGSFSIRGAGAYDLVTSLLANLDGSHTIEEIVEGLPGPARDSVLRLVSVLELNGFVKAVDYPAELAPKWMKDLYPTQLTFLDHHADRPVSRMMRVRASSVVCAGEGVALRSLLGVAGEFGLANVVVVTTDAELARTADVIKWAQDRDPLLRWRTVITGAALDPTSVLALPEVDAAALVLYATDTGDHTVLGKLHRRIAHRGQRIGLIGRCGDFIIAVPAAKSTGWCWECVYRCIAGSVQGDAADLTPATAPATFGCLHIVQHAFAQLAGIESDGGTMIISVEPLAPVVRVHSARRHALCPGHADSSVARPVDTNAEGGLVRPDLPASHDSPAIVAESDRIVSVAAHWIDQVVGPLLSVGEGPEDQLPLSVSSCTVVDPRSTADIPITRLINCRGLSSRETRNQVLLLAMEWLAAKTAAVGNVAPEFGRAKAFGAGWSPAEAVYRAHVALATSLPQDTLTWIDTPGAGWSERPVRAYLAESLAAAGRTWRATALELLPIGLVRATVRTADGHAVADVGIDEEHAIDNALLRAATATMAGQTAPAHLAPPVDNWADAAALVAKEAGRRVTIVDASTLVPVIGSDAFVVAATPAGASE
jgi:hypothetical protein